MHRVTFYSKKSSTLMILFFISNLVGFSCHHFVDKNGSIMSKPLTQAQELLNISRTYLHYCQFSQHKNEYEKATVFYKKANHACQQALKIDDHYAPAHYHRAVVLHASGDYDNTVKHLQRAMSLDKNYKEPYLLLGALQIAHHHIDQAAHTYKLLLAHHPNNTIAKHQLEAIQQKQIC